MKHTVQSRTYSRKASSQRTNNELFSSHHDVFSDNDSSRSDKGIENRKIQKTTLCPNKENLCDKTTSEFKLPHLPLHHEAAGEQQPETMPVHVLSHSSHSTILNIDHSLLDQTAITNSTNYSVTKKDELLSLRSFTLPKKPCKQTSQPPSAIPCLTTKPSIDRHISTVTKPPNPNVQNSYTYNWVMTHGISGTSSKLSSATCTLPDNEKSIGSSKSSSASSSIEILRDAGNEGNRFRLEKSVTFHLPRESLDKPATECTPEIDDVLEPENQTPIKSIHTKPSNCRPKKAKLSSSNKSQKIKPKSSSFLFPENAVDVENHFPHDISEIVRHSLEDKLVTETAPASMSVRKSRSEMVVKRKPDSLSSGLLIKKHRLVADTHTCTDTDEIELPSKQRKYTRKAVSKYQGCVPETIRYQRHLPISIVPLKTGFPFNKAKNYSSEDDYETIGDYETVSQGCSEGGIDSRLRKEASEIQMEPPIILPVTPPQVTTDIDLHAIDVQLKNMGNGKDTGKENPSIGGMEYMYLDEVDGVKNCDGDVLLDRYMRSLQLTLSFQNNENQTHTKQVSPVALVKKHTCKQNFRASTPKNKDSSGNPWSTVLSSVNEPSASASELVIHPPSRFVKSDEIVASSTCTNVSDISKTMSKKKQKTRLETVQKQKATKVGLDQDCTVKSNKSVRTHTSIRQHQMSKPSTYKASEIASVPLSESPSDHIGTSLDILCDGSITKEMCIIPANVLRKIRPMTSRTYAEIQRSPLDVLLQSQVTIKD